MSLQGKACNLDVLTCYSAILCNLPFEIHIIAQNACILTCAVVMASVVMYIRYIGTWCMTCFITFDDLSGHSYSSTFFQFFINLLCSFFLLYNIIILF